MKSRATPAPRTAPNVNEEADHHEDAGITEPAASPFHHGSHRHPCRPPPAPARLAVLVTALSAAIEQKQ